MRLNLKKTQSRWLDFLTVDRPDTVGSSMIPKDSQALSLWTCVFIMLQEKKKKKGIKVVYAITVTNQVMENLH